MERREKDTSIIEPSTSSNCETRSMIDITFNMKENDMFADVKVFSFNLILSMDFLLKLSTFLQPESSSSSSGSNLNSADNVLEQKELESSTAARRRRSSFSAAASSQQQEENEKKAIFAIHIEEYDIILVEKMDDINCLALILNVSHHHFLQ
jgi:vacuolar protein sorting-associated protein 13A/C